MTHLRLRLAQRLRERVADVAHALHARLKLPHAVVLHAPPLDRRAVARGGGASVRRLEGEAGLAVQVTLEGGTAGCVGCLRLRWVTEV